MALKVTNDDAAIAYAALKQRLRAFRSYTQSVRNACEAGAVSANLLIEYYLRLVNEKAANTAATAVPGIAQWAQDRDGGVGYDVAAEFTAVNAAIDNTRDWISTNFPSSGGYLQKDQLTVDGVTVRSFQPSQTAGFRAVLDALLATMI